VNNLLIAPKESIKRALEMMSEAGQKCLVVSELGRLQGTLSDGDIRRAILAGAQLTDSIKNYVNENPTYLYKDQYARERLKHIFLDLRLDLIPVISESGEVIDILFWDQELSEGEKTEQTKIKVPVVIMAGGMGTRLEPFTKVLPKPLVPVGDKPVIEHIIEKFTKSGVDQIYLTVNYKSRILKAFFEELQPTYSINFIEENEPLGTAGSLSQLSGKVDDDIFVTNCDVIVDTDYSDLLEFHRENGHLLTLVASTKDYIIPYGACHLNKDGHLDHIDEKPKYEFLVNAGLYVLNPSLLDIIPDKKRYDITDLIAHLLELGESVGVYPIVESSWIDIGEWSEYRKAVELFVT